MIPISQLKVGDKVLATNAKTGKTSAEPVAAVLVHHDTDLYDLKIMTSHGTSVIRATSGHLFWDLTRHQWVKAAALRHGDHLRTTDGKTVTVIGGQAPRDRDGWMWDLTVPGNNDHDFYIDVDATAILVHNSCTNMAELPERAVRNITTDENYAFQRLSLNHGVDSIEFSDQLHAIKLAEGLPPDFDLGFGPTGDVWNPISGDLIGQIVHGG